MDYFKKYDTNPAKDLLWNVPETKQGNINLIGGHASSFRTVIKTAEFLSTHYPLQNVQVVLPDALKDKVPSLPNFTFLSSTDSGSFKDDEELKTIYQTADFNLLIGDFSKNEITKVALEKSLENPESIPKISSENQIETRPVLITRDTVDLLATENAGNWLANENLIILASLAQLQKLLHAIYYPRILLLSQSLLQVAETLHKFTLSYPVKIITLHNNEILIAENGQVAAINLENSNYSPFMFWSGEVAAKIAALNLYNPRNFEKATLAAVFAN